MEPLGDSLLSYQQHDDETEIYSDSFLSNQHRIITMSLSCVVFTIPTSVVTTKSCTTSRTEYLYIATYAHHKFNTQLHDALIAFQTELNL